MMTLGVLRVGRLSSALQPTCSVFLLHKMDNSTAANAKEQKSNVRPYEEMPGPKPLPFVGNAWRFVPYIGTFSKLQPKEMADKLKEKYGNIFRITDIKGRNDMVYLFDPQDFETVFRNEGQWPIRGNLESMIHYRKKERKDFFKGMYGLAVTEGKEWQDFRSKVNQAMMQPRNTKQYVGPIDEVALDLVARMREIRNEEGRLPETFVEYLMRWALESISLVALDTRLGCLDKDFKPDSEAQKMIDGTHLVFQAIAELDLKPTMGHFTTKKLWKDTVKALDYSVEVSMKYINKAMERIKTKVAKGERELSVLELLLLKNEDPMVAIVMALDMMQAGIDTTSHAAGTLLHYLARNQDKQEKLFQELKSILPSKDTIISAQELENMKYLKACAKESMRLSPTAPGNLRQTAKDVVLSNYLVPKGVDCLMVNQNISTDEKYFHQAHKFIPERWLKGADEQQKVNPFVLLPFGFGPRMCIGRRFAELEIETVVAKIIRNFRIEYDRELEVKTVAINMVVSPLDFKLEERP